MAYTADYLIQKRKEKWEELQSIEYDKQFRDAVANEILTNADLFKEVYEHPEKLVELCFIVVDKNQQTIRRALIERPASVILLQRCTAGFHRHSQSSHSGLRSRNHNGYICCNLKRQTARLHNGCNGTSACLQHNTQELPRVYLG